MKTAFLFPGQGSQYVGMGVKAAEANPDARRIFDDASSSLGFDVLELCGKGPADRLNMTEFTQPAILTASIAAFQLAKERGIKPDILAGHSLGEYSALVAGGGLSFIKAVDLVHKRGRFMQAAVPEGAGSMAAILGMTRENVERVCREASGHGVVSPANYNSPIQTVIGGEKKAVEAASALAREKGAKRVVPLSVSVPSHCSLMEPAAEQLKPELDSVAFNSLEVPVVTNADASPVSTGDEARSALLRQLAAPVRWVETIEWMLKEGVSVFVEVGPGNVLAGLVKRIAKGSTILKVEDRDSAEATLKAISP